MARLTKDELEERVEHAAFLMARRLPKSQIKRNLMDAYNLTSARQVERYMAGARKLARAASRVKPDEALRQAINFYNSVISDPDANIFEKLKAQERLDKLYGHDQYNIKLSGDPKNPIAIHGTVVTIDAMSMIDKARSILKEAEAQRVGIKQIQAIENTPEGSGTPADTGVGVTEAGDSGEGKSRGDSGSEATEPDDKRVAESQPASSG